MTRLQNFKDYIIEISVLIKACLTGIWFWVPIVYCIGFYLQIWLMFFVHPLTLLIFPSILLVYLVVKEEKRARIYYKLNGIKYLSASHPLGEGPQVKPFKWEVERALKEYEEMLKKRQIEDKA